MNKTPTLFAAGLVIGALAVFLVRAATGGAGTEPAAPPEAAPAHGGAEHDAGGHAAAGHAAKNHDVHPAEAAERPPGSQGLIEVRLAGDGDVAAARMRMPDGSAHPVRAGGQAPMGDYRAVVLGREGSLAAHLHAHGDGRLELTLTDGSGARVAQRIFTPAENRPPENQVCPVMGNEVDPDVYVDYRGRRVGFCCAGCDETFLKDPERYLAKVDKELAARKGGR